MKNRRADEEKTTELGDEQQHRPERAGARQYEEENGEGGDHRIGAARSAKQGIKAAEEKKRRRSEGEKGARRSEQQRRRQAEEENGEKSPSP